MRRPSLPSNRTPAGVRARGWVILGVLVVAGVLVTLRPWSQERVLSWDAISTGLSGLAALCCFLTARASRGALRRSWAMFGTTLAMWTVADLLWYAYGTADGFRPVLSTADALYLLGLVPATLGLVLYPVGTWEPGARARLLLDIVVLGGALLLISELLVLGEVVARVGLSWDAFVYVVYPVTDVLLAGLAVLLLLRSSGTPRVDLALIALAFGTWTAADNGYALLSARGLDYAGTPVDVAYAVAPALLGVAALYAPREAARVRTLRRHVSGKLALLVPDLASLAALSTCVVTGLHGSTEWVMAAMVLALTAARQFARTIDNEQLHTGLEQLVTKRTEDLEQLAARHQRMLDSVGEGIFGVDRHLRISFVNPAAARLLGWEPEDLLGKDACRTLCTEEHEECLISMVMALGEVVTQSARTYRRRDGSQFPVEVTASPKDGPTGNDGAVVVFRDITEREVIDAMKQQFISAVSHELRMPLTAIRGSLELLSDGDTGELPAEAQPIVEMATRGAERLTRLVNDIIDIERMEAGSFDVRPRPEDLAPLVVDATDSVVSLAAERRVRVEIASSDGSALCDADRIVQALVNLIGNAVKFTQPGGTVRVSTTSAAHEVLVTVRDEGRGIPTEELENIFERFHQVHHADGRRLGGTGLGLPITKAIVERHGGRIWVESEVGVGSAFCFTLPSLGEPVSGEVPRDVARSQG